MALTGQPSTPQRMDNRSRLSGADLEYKLAGLVSSRLRAERRRRPKLNLRFKVSSNYAETDPIGEIAVRLKWTEDGRQRRMTYFVQVQHEDSSKRLTFEELKSENSRFSLVRCYKQYKNLRTNAQKTPLKRKKDQREHQCHPDDCRFVLFSPRNVFHSKWSSKASSSLLFTFEDVFDTGRGEVFSFGERDEEVWCLLEGEDKEIFRKEFLPRLRIFCGQASGSNLDALLTTSILDGIGRPLPREQRIVDNLLTSLRLWWQRADGTNLSEKSNEIYKVLREDIMSNLNSTCFNFQSSHCDDLGRILNRHRTVYVTVPEVSCKARCSKIRQILEENLTCHSKYSRRHLIVSESCLLEYPHDILESLCENYCGVLVIDLDNVSDKTLSFMLNVIDIVKTLIVLSSTFIPKVQKFLRKHGRMYTQFEDPWTLDQMSLEDQEQFIRRSVVFQGHEMALYELESVWPSLRSVVGGGTLEALALRKTVTLGAALPPEEKNYVPRNLQHRSELRSDVFNHYSQNDYFLLSEFPEDVLLYLRSTESSWEECGLMQVATIPERPARNYNALKTIQQNTTYKTRWSVWEKECSPEKFAEKLGQNVHWLSYEGSTIIWKHTYGDMQVLGKYVDRQSQNCQDNFICSHDDISDFLNWNNPTILLSGDVGEGKSTFMIRMANRIKEERKSHWVVLLKINQEQMMDDLPANVKFDDVVDLLEKATHNDHTLGTKLTKHFLRDCLQKSGSIAVLVDVVAEICPSHISKVQRVLSILQESRAQFLCVAATTSSDAALKSVLKCSPSALQPFSAEDQQKYLMAHWSKGLGRKEKQSMQKQVRRLVEAVSEITDYDGRRLCDVPLYTRMLAVSYNGDEMKKLLRDCMAEVQLKMSLLKVYRKFVQEGRKSFRPKKVNTTCHSTNLATAASPENLLNQLKSYAAFQCFNNRKWLGENYKSCKKSIMEIINNFDIEIPVLMAKRADGRPDFLHHTFREYFAALWCVDHYKSLPSLTRALYSDRFVRVRSFFDALLAEGHTLHEAALSGSKAVVTAALQEGHDVDGCDRGGRRPLHLAASYGHRESVALLLEARSNAANRDSVQSWTPLRYADNALQLSAAEELLRGGGSRDDVQRIPQEFSFGKITHADIVKGDMVQILHILTHPRSQCPYFCTRQPPDPPGEIWEEAAVAGSVKVAEILMNSGVDIHQITTSGMTALHITSFCGNEEFTRLLLRHGVNVDAVDCCGETALHKAVRCGHKSICQELLQFGANSNAKDMLDRTPLYQSVIKNDKNCLWELLMGHNIDINGQTREGTTALHAAARFGNERACQKLIECGANVSLRDCRGTTPLQSAAKAGNENICRLLLLKDANVNAEDDYGCTALHYAAFSKQASVRTCRLLLEYGADINVRNSIGETALLTSTRAENQWMCRTLFRYKPDINISDVQRRTVLHDSVLRKSDNVPLILKLGADMNCQDSEGHTPLHLAAELGNEDVCRLLIERGADVRRCSKVDGFPLHAAAESGHLWICRLLIEQGADVCSKDSSGTSVLHRAAKSGHDAICCLLLQQGADPNSKDKYGRNALADASRAGHETICKMLLEFGAEVHARDSRGQTPLHAAARGGHDGICHTLLMYRANINARDSSGLSPLQLAAAHNHRVVCHLLVEQGADVRLKDSQEVCALVTAASKGHQDICRLLLKSGADIQAADWEGTTALHAATKRSHEEVCRVLLDHAPDVNAKDLQSRSSIDYAENKEIYKLLKKRSENRRRSIKWSESNRYGALFLKINPLLHFSTARK